MFIVFEGIDCSGTSTQAQLLTAKLREMQRKVSLTSEPSGGPIGQLIRTYFSGRLDVAFTHTAQDRFFGCLFAADRLDHIFNPVNGVNKHLIDGVDVVSTRYKFSSLAYNAETEQERAFITTANSELPNPDALIYLRCPLEVSLYRMRERVTRETYEKNKSKLARALINFERELNEYTDRKIVLDATAPVTSLAEEVLAFVLDVRSA